MSKKALPVSPAGHADSIVLRPNRSLSARGMAMLFGGVAGSVAVLAVIFLNSGAWPVVPFLGLELAAVAATLWLQHRHTNDCEIIRLEDDRLEVVQRRGRSETCHRFPRYWARVVMEPSPNNHHPSRLVIRSHGRELEVGAGMTEEARRVLTVLLSRAMRPAVTHEPARGPITLYN